MQPRSLVTQEWSVHAEVVFSHGDGPQPSNHPTTARSVPVPGGDVRMEYSWGDGTVRPSYGFQRGNILFTSTPPPRARPETVDGGHVVYGTLPLRRGGAQQQQPYNRRCKSTCSIVLSDARQQSPHPVRCGDPGCYHSEVTGSVTTCAPEPGSCEVCGGGRSPTSARRATAANTFTTHFCTRLPEKQAPQRQQQDASSQTDFGESKFLQVPETDNTAKKVSKRLSRSPARLRGRSPLLQRKKSQASQCSGSRCSSLEPEDSPRKPRTVHIDVYCTGSDASVSSEAETTEESSPQTVYESEQYRVVHTKVGKERLPKALLRSFRKCESFKQSRGKVVNTNKGYDSDDGLSSPYPSKLTSYDSLFKAGASVPGGSSAKSRDASWSTISSTRTRLDDECESLSTTWKDTATDLALSCSSVLDSVDLNLAQSDSFEYADTSDRLRIREKERAWGEGDKTWRSPNTERKFLMQQRKQNDFLKASSSKESCSFITTDTDEDDDDTGDAWSFIRSISPKMPLKRESTVRKGPGGKPESGSRHDVRSQTLPASGNVRRFCETGSLSDSGASSLHRFTHRMVIGPFGEHPPAPPVTKVESSITAPFSALLGSETDRLSKAQRFGAIVETLRKPGHHVGPSKNPDCLCVHCRKFYEDRFQRCRARSVGEVPSGGSYVNNVRDFVKGMEHLNKTGAESDSDAGTPV